MMQVTLDYSHNGTILGIRFGNVAYQMTVRIVRLSSTNTYDDDYVYPVPVSEASIRSNVRVKSRRNECVGVTALINSVIDRVHAYARLGCAREERDEKVRQEVINQLRARGIESEADMEAADERVCSDCGKSTDPRCLFSDICADVAMRDASSATVVMSHHHERLKPSLTGGLIGFHAIPKSISCRGEVESAHLLGVMEIYGSPLVFTVKGLRCTDWGQNGIEVYPKYTNTSSSIIREFIDREILFDME